MRSAVASLDGHVLVILVDFNGFFPVSNLRRLELRSTHEQ